MTSPIVAFNVTRLVNLREVPVSRVMAELSRRIPPAILLTGEWVRE
jgi:hypothetical protein